MQHKRFVPRSHQFEYSLVMPLLDLDDIDNLEQILPQVKVNQKSWRYSFYEEDYLRDHLVPGESLKQRAYRCLQEQLQKQILKQNQKQDNGSTTKKLTEQSYSGQILMLSHWRFCNKVFNPITLYYFVSIKGQLEYVLVEVSNTPWNQRTLYIHQIQPDETGVIHRVCKKQFHVSPFNPMDMFYHWRFRFTPTQISLHLGLEKAEQHHFSASFKLESIPLSASTFDSEIKKQPMMSWHGVIGIYWQALKLFFKRIPFYNHPEQHLDIKK